ncbi:hypothetical protein ILYODFUR_025244 [Ilyodon furcidens]|uniref:Uncharacterized protein n=1 Tax=Ilyodon furcidens TaxID=33524 RepID=A0ABV0UV67_9TELE
MQHRNPDLQRFQKQSRKSWASQAKRARYQQPRHQSPSQTKPGPQSTSRFQQAHPASTPSLSTWHNP